MEQWAYCGEQCGTPFPILLGPGDILVQPSGTSHAPLSFTLVWMTGVMPLDSRDMARTAFLAVA
jgi:hypothetical protein